MSELIVPKSYQNPMLEANLKAFFLRFPHERSRLEPLLSRPVENQPVVKIELPAVPSAPPMRMLLLASIVSPLFLKDILNDKTIQEDTFKVFIVENNLDLLASAFQHWDITQLINYSKTEWMLMMNEEMIKPSIFRVLKREENASMMKNIHILETNLQQPKEVSAFYAKLPIIYNETVFHVLHNFGRIGDSLDGVRATLLNEKTLLNKAGIEDLRGAFKGIPALIVGAGPSLDRYLDQIKANNNKYVVICADAALKPLLKAGIRVDYVTSIERLNDYQKPFFEGLENVTTELVAFPVVLPSQFELYPGKIRLVYRNYSYFAYFEKSWPKGILKCGGSTSHLAVRLADWMGCSRIVLLGIDSCYEKQEGAELYRSHCSNTGHPEWSEFIPIREFDEKRKHLPPIVGINNLGKEVVTNLTYYQWAKEYSEELSEIGHRIPILNCSSEGLQISGIEYRDFKYLSEQFDEREIKTPETSAVRFNRTFDHKVILKNFENWLKLADDCITETSKELTAEQFEVVVFIYNFKFAVDSLFISFVVQCCAKEFFELENIWWSYNKQWDLDIPGKTAVLKQRFELFKDVLQQLITIFKETGNG